MGNKYLKINTLKYVLWKRYCIPGKLIYQISSFGRKDFFVYPIRAGIRAFPWNKKTSVNPVVSNKMKAFQKLEQLRGDFPAGFDPDIELAEAREAKYGNMVDTNVILDYLVEREVFFEEGQKLFKKFQITPKVLKKSSDI